MAERARPPSQEVLAGFGTETETPVAIDGGQWESWRVGNLVLKPTTNIPLSQWLSGVLSLTHHRQVELAQPLFRVARPTQVSGSKDVFVFQGWTAAEFIQGVPDVNLEPRLAEIVQASRAMHQVLKSIVMKSQANTILSSRSDRWAYADRFAWDEITISEIPDVNLSFFESELEPHLTRLNQLKRPLPDQLECQLVHGDLAGNMLFAGESTPANLPPGIIDFDVYWRPVEYAEAILIVDGLTWQKFGLDQVKSVGWSKLRYQMLVRSLIFRIVQFAIHYDEGFVSRNWRKIDVEHAMRLMETSY